jgi:DNA-binding NarL/FixJ family response regulator
VSVLTLPERRTALSVSVLGDVDRASLEVLRVLRAGRIRASLNADPDGSAVVVSRGEAEETLATVESLDPSRPIVVVVDAGVPAGVVRRMLRAGVRGIVFEEQLAAALVATVHAACAGQVAVPASILSPLSREPLSHREREVLNLVALGCTNRQIADRMYLAESTVKSHLSSVFAKLRITSRSEAAALALDAGPGLLQADAPAPRPAELAAVGALTRHGAPARTAGKDKEPVQA